MIPISPVALRLTTGILPLLAVTAALGQESEAAFDRTPRDCLVVTQIDSTEAIDDQTIIFRTRGKRVYRNTLPRTCPGLLRENRIAWESRTSQLCSVDMITVLEDVGFGIRPGFTCRLGEFAPMSPADIEDLEFRKKNGGAPQVIETSSVEVEGEDEATTDGSEPTPAPEASPAAEEPPAPQ